MLRVIGIRCITAILPALLLMSCSMQLNLQRAARQTILSDSSLRHAHVGISVFDPQKKAWLYNHQSDRYFVPASNTKIITCYAALSLLGDSLEGMAVYDADTAYILEPTGDPTFLHPDFKHQPVRSFFEASQKPMYVFDHSWQTPALGAGWSWDDYSAAYMAERSPLPVYGNVLRWKQTVARKERPSSSQDTVDVFITSDPDISWKVDFTPPDPGGRFSVDRSRHENRFIITQGKQDGAAAEVPFITHGTLSAIELLNEYLEGKDKVHPWQGVQLPVVAHRHVIRSVPVDSMLRPMMHRSDNFMAEQSLLMVSRQLIGQFRVDKAADSLLKTVFAGMPHAPRWADGSGLSRYNLFTPQDFVWVLDKMQSRFGMDRIHHILPTAGSGTLSAMDKTLAGHVYAKTGTLSGVVALSGYVQTKKGKWLVFSLLVNHHRTSAPLIRKRFEEFLMQVSHRN